jgi:hypothetical protein
MDILTTETSKPKRKPREASFWQRMKNNLPGDWFATRLESRATLGVPDLLLQGPDGRWHLVELKTTDRERIDISPHQVAFATKHARGSCWVAIGCRMEEGSGVYLYRGNSIMDLKLEGLAAKPDHFFPEPVDWKKFFEVLDG